MTSGAGGASERAVPGPNRHPGAAEAQRWLAPEPVAHDDATPAPDKDEQDTQDTQDTHDAQAALRRSEALLWLYRKVFDNVAEGSFITDASRRIVAVNPAFTQICGYSLEDAARRRPGVLKADRTPLAQYRSMWRCVRNDGEWHGELRCRTKGGEERPESVTIRALRDDQGRLTHYLVFFSDLAACKAQEDRANFLAQHDPLTGLPNRHLLGDRLLHALASASRHGGQVALLFLDLDRFKVINDSLGHRVGDLLLCSVAARLKALIREEDTVARLGGDEFVFVIPQFERSEIPAHVAQKIIWAMAQPHDIEGQHFTTGASVGISLYPGDAKDGEQLIRNADSAMYKAKARGGNCYEFYTANMTSRAMERLILENSLRGGLERNEFMIFYQPKVEVATGRVAGAEALLRWSHPVFGVLSPDKFIPVAEETGLIVEIGDWVLRGACRQNKRWQEQGLAPVPISVNVSARQCKQGLAALVRRALDESGLAPQYLELELTESTLMADVAALLHELKSMGVQLSIDDFGTGYSSLSYLKHFPIDSLKIDKSLIAEIGIGDRNSAIAGAAISLAHSLNLKVVAEGAYAAWQARYLRERGCDLVQGYYYGRPLPANKFAALLRHRKTIRLGPGYIHGRGSGTGQANAAF
jgi:diguanylate cyclase (GGDEF)-like protein/PAS domain S-box-containing protein